MAVNALKGFFAVLVGLLMLHVAGLKEISSTISNPGTHNSSRNGSQTKRMQQEIDPDLIKDPIWLIT